MRVENQTWGERVVEASTEEAADAVLAVERYPTWAGQISQVCVLERDTEGRPRRARMRLDAGLIRDTLLLEYGVRRSGQRTTLTWNLVQAEHLKALTGRYEVEPSGPGRCRIRYALSVDPGIPVITALRVKAEQRVIAVALDDLQRHLEEARRA